MEAARRAGKDGALLHNGSRISLYNDFSAAVMKKRKAYDTVKQQLRERGIAYAMFFPATLQVSQEGSKKRFVTPEQVRSYMDTLPAL